MSYHRPKGKGRTRLLRLLEARDGWRCWWCEREYRTFTLDHVVPLGIGGCRHNDNYVLACKTCNAKRGGGFDTPVWPPDAVVEHIRSCPEIANERARRWYGGSPRTVTDLSLVPARDRR